MVGTVKFFQDEKGWGIIESSGEDYFAHHSDIDRTQQPAFRSLRAGQPVEFTAQPSGKGNGLKAVAIRIIGTVEG